MSSTTKIYEEKMNNCVAHLDRELTSIRAGRANPGILDKVMVDYYGSPTPVQQVASVAVSEARILTITPWDGTLIKAISKEMCIRDRSTEGHVDAGVQRLVQNVGDEHVGQTQAVVDIAYIDKAKYAQHCHGEGEGADPRDELAALGGLARCV